MTQEEKFKAIIDRLGPQASEFKPIHLSILIIMGYMEELFKDGVIHDGAVETTEIGKKAMALCQEFNWAPSDSDIVAFVKDMVEQSQWESFVIMLRQMRDNKEEFLKNAKKHIGY